MKGSCRCGAVSSEVTECPNGESACHCYQCRRQSGHVWFSAHVGDDGSSVTGALEWYEASAAAKRGFCPTRGAFLFWTARDEDTISFSPGSVDGPTGLRLERHIFTESKGDYYDISNGVPWS